MWIGTRVWEVGDESRVESGIGAGGGGDDGGAGGMRERDGDSGEESGDAGGVFGSAWGSDGRPAAGGGDDAAAVCGGDYRVWIGGDQCVYERRADVADDECDGQLQLPPDVALHQW